MKSKSRKFLSLFLAVVMVIAVIPLRVITVSAETTSGDFEYSVISGEEKTCEITKYNGEAAELDIPSQLDGYAVTRIDSGAFQNCALLTSIAIPDSVTSIGIGAFGDCTSLASIAIPDSVTSIGNMVFYGTAYYNDESNWENDVLYIGNHLIAAKRTISGEYSIKEGTKTIADEAFYGCTSLTSITIPESITRISYGTFWYCTSLTSIQIPDGVTSIGDDAFFKCTSLASITIPDSVTSIEHSAFDNTAYYNDESNWENGVLYIGKHLIKAKDTLSGEYIIKNGTVCIADSAFENCTSLEGITIPDSVTSIGLSAFRGCTLLTSVTIGNGVTSIGDFTFEECVSLASVTIGNGVTSIGHYAFCNCISLTSVTIPDSVTSIGWYCFFNCTSLTSITIPNGVTSIGNAAFQSCTSLTSITIPDSVTSIGSGAFSGCTLLTSINIPVGVTSIGGATFHSCTSLTSITIPDSVTSIGDYAFFNCTSLTSITIPNGVTSVGEEAFCNCTSLTSIAIPDSLTNIGYLAFYGCSALQSISVSADNENYCDIDGILFNKTATELICCPEGKSGDYKIPDSVTSIGECAFIDCTSLSSITIPNSVTSIGDEAFRRCTFASITIGNGVTSIGSYAFCNCTSLTSVTIPNSVTSIGYGAFSACYALQSISVSADNENYCDIDGVLFNKTATELICCPAGKSGDYTIPDGVTSIGDGTFSDCTSLEGITIPDSVTSIGDYAFLGCTSLESITIPDSVTSSIGNGAFMGCKLLASVTIGNGVTSIGDNAFSDCISLTSVTIGNGVTSIGYDAFSDCDALQSISVSADNENYCDIDGVLFNKTATELICCPAGKSGDYTIPDSVTSIGWSAFGGCTSLKSVTIPKSVTSIGDYAFNGCDNLTIYGYSGSYAETYANENSIPFVALKSIVQFDKSQIRFHGVGADKDFTNYKDTFDVRTVAKISQEDFRNTFGTDEEALKNITDIGFIYAAEKNVATFDLETAKKVAEGTGTDENYIKKSVSNIQHAGDGADYIFTCIVTDVPDADKEQKGYCFAYVCCNGTYYYFDDVTVMDFNALYTANKPQA